MIIKFFEIQNWKDHFNPLFYKWVKQHKIGKEIVCASTQLKDLLSVNHCEIES